VRKISLKNWLRVDNVIAMKTMVRFFGPPCSRGNRSILLEPSKLYQLWLWKAICKRIIAS